MRRIHHDHTSAIEAGRFDAVDRQLSAAAQQIAQQICLRRITQCQLNATHTVVLLPFPGGNEACGRQYVLSLPARFPLDRTVKSRASQPTSELRAGQTPAWKLAIQGPEGITLRWQALLGVSTLCSPSRVTYSPSLPHKIARIHPFRTRVSASYRLQSGLRWGVPNAWRS
jgi:hypothetical protein